MKVDHELFQSHDTGDCQGRGLRAEEATAFLASVQRACASSTAPMASASVFELTLTPRACYDQFYTNCGD